jgi:hypothetical protein
MGSELVVMLLVLRSGRIFLLLITITLSQPQGNTTVGKIKSNKKPNELIGNRTRDLPTCSIVPQPTALQRSAISLLEYVQSKTEAWRKITDSLKT